MTELTNELSPRTGKVGRSRGRLKSNAFRLSAAAVAVAAGVAVAQPAYADYHTSAGPWYFACEGSTFTAAVHYNHKTDGTSREQVYAQFITRVAGSARIDAVWYWDAGPDISQGSRSWDIWTYTYSGSGVTSSAETTPGAELHSTGRARWTVYFTNGHSCTVGADGSLLYGKAG